MTLKRGTVTIRRQCAIRELVSLGQGTVDIAMYLDMEIGYVRTLTCYFLGKELSDRERGISWSSERVGRVMQQLKYRSLVEFSNGTWRPTA